MDVVGAFVRPWKAICACDTSMFSFLIRAPGMVARCTMAKREFVVVLATSIAIIIAVALIMDIVV